MVRFTAYSGCDCRLPAEPSGNQGGYHECRPLSSIFAALRLCQFRRIAIRYDKHIQNYLGFVKIAAIAI
jgi:hypothetical protein